MERRWGAAIETIVPTDFTPVPAGNRTLHYTFSTTTAYVKFDLDSVTVKDRFIEGERYKILFNFYKEAVSTITPFRFNDEPPWEIPAKKSWDEGYTRSDAYLDDTEVMADSVNSFYIDYAVTNQEGYIDDFRIVRTTGIDYYLKFRVPYSEEGRPNLYPGTYRFSVYFKAEDNNAILPHPSAPERFRSSRVSLGISKTENSPGIKGFDCSVELSSGEWKKLYIDKFIQIKEGDSLYLFISPADNTGKETIDIGSVLVAYPELYYISE